MIENKRKNASEKKKLFPLIRFHPFFLLPFILPLPSADSPILYPPSHSHTCISDNRNVTTTMLIVQGYIYEYCMFKLYIFLDYGHIYKQFHRISRSMWLLLEIQKKIPSNPFKSLSISSSVSLSSS